MSKTNFNELLEAGVHFGHLKRKWNPAMAPYIFMERNGIHIIDLQKTEAKLNEACSALKQIAKSGRKILFVATKKQAKDIVAEKVKPTQMPYVTERWPGGMLTNFPTIRRAIKKMSTIDKMEVDGTFKNLAKREKLQVTRQRAKLEKMLGSISDMTRLPAAMFIVDVSKEHIAVREAKRLNIPLFGIVDTNSDPTNIDFPIPANDDASKSISLLIDLATGSIQEGLDERKMEKEKDGPAKENKKGSDKPNTDAKKTSARKTEEAPAEKIKVEEPKTEEVKTEKPKTEEVNTEEVKAEAKKEEKE
ncbi:MAG: 30S ribosomal protein S2 [Bacteroidales bacterium]|jgi:small subunit ribosomal protein S2|nr:30S ribosomal protein S2 [Bacteroidales bacterium]